MLVPVDPEPTKGRFLETLLDRVGRMEPIRFNLVMLIVIVLLSALLSFGLWNLTVAWLDMDAPQGSGLLIAAIAALVSFVVAAPSVFLGYALISRINSIGTSLRQALSAADLANRSKTEFLAHMSHEVRTPLNGILGMTQLLERGALDQDQRQALSVIRESGDVLMAIISEVMDLSKIDIGKVTLEPAPQPLGPVLSFCAELFRAKAIENGNSLSMTFAPGVPEFASYDSVRARQCLANLISNAVKFTRNGEIVIHVTSRAEQDGWMIEVSVRDTGIGVAEEDLPRLFQPFQQVGHKSPQVQGGTGLGLAISRRLAELMGGDLVVRSVLGEGSEFLFSFRAGRVEGGALTPSAAPSLGKAAPLAGVTALVVDDIPTNRIVARSMLQALGAKCLEAATGSAALDMALDRPIDIILLDIRMPDKDGFEVLNDLRLLGGKAAGIPVIAVTADVLSARSDEYLAWGFAGFLSKPIDIDELAALVSAAVPPARPGTEAPRP